MSKEIIKEKLNNLSVEELKNVIKELVNDFREGTNTVFCFALDVLENKIPENEYINFCDNLQ
jgi:hypothetical protein